MMPEDSRLQFRTSFAERRAALARLRRVNEALCRWDETHAATETSKDLRPPPVRQPSVKLGGAGVLATRPLGRGPRDRAGL
jgi:hypothetical protein